MVNLIDKVTNTTHKFLGRHYLQVVHSHSNHWITVGTIGCQHSEIKVYDSFCNEVDTATTNKLEKTLSLLHGKSSMLYVRTKSA